MTCAYLENKHNILYIQKGKHFTVINQEED